MRQAVLGEICDVRDGTHDSPKYCEDGYFLLTSKNFSSGKIDYEGAKRISKIDFEAINKRSKVDIGDIVMPMIGTIGSPVIVNEKPDFAIKNVALIKSSPNVSMTYIQHFLDSSHFIKQVQKSKRGGTQKFVSLGDLRNLKIPLPPLAEQQRIAAILDKADALRQARRRSLQRLNDLSQSIFYEMFGDPVTNRQNLPVQELKGIIKVRSGDGLTADNQNGGQYPVFGGNGINGWHDEFNVEKNTIVIGRVGVYCGSVYVTGNRAWVTDNALIVNPLQDTNITYLAHALKFANLNQYAGRSSQPLVSGNRIYPVQIMVPCIDSQTKYENRLLQINKLDKVFSSNEKKVENFFLSLQQRAFNGEL